MDRRRRSRSRERSPRRRRSRSRSPRRSPVSRRPERSEAFPGVGMILQAEIANIQGFGAFCRLEGFRDGLLHISQLMDSRVEDVNDVVEVGERVWVKVLSADTETGRVGLSMKFIDQKTGKDLDPNGLKASFASEQKRTNPHERAPVVLEAVLKTTCQRCGGHGHLKGDCFVNVTAGEQYELVASDDEKEAVDKPKKKHRKHKHHHSHRKHHRH